MADNVTAATQAAGFDRAGGFGATEQKTDNSEQINDLLNQARDLMIEDGTDPATAEALTNYARPAAPAYAGNLADLMRMGQIAVTGTVHTPAGQDDIEATNLEEAFATPPQPDLNTGLQTPMGQIDAEGKPTGQNVGEGDDGGDTADVGTDSGADSGAETGGDTGGGEDLSTLTKAELTERAETQGVQVSSSMTKQDIIDALNEGGTQ